MNVLKCLVKGVQMSLLGRYRTHNSYASVPRPLGCEVGAGRDIVFLIHQNILTCRPDAWSSPVRSTGIRDRLFSYLGGGRGRLQRLPPVDGRVYHQQSQFTVPHCRQPHRSTSPYVVHSSMSRFQRCSSSKYSIFL